MVYSQRFIRHKFDRFVNDLIILKQSSCMLCALNCYNCEITIIIVLHMLELLSIITNVLQTIMIIIKKQYVKNPERRVEDWRYITRVHLYEGGGRGRRVRERKHYFSNLLTGQVTRRVVIITTRVQSYVHRRPITQLLILSRD